jgi:hypothetical protein
MAGETAFASSRPGSIVMPEKVIFKRGDLLVTQSRFHVGAKTYAIRNIVTTRGLVIKPGFIDRILRKKTRYVVVITTTAGEIQAYESPEPELIDRLLNALDRAIAGSS